MSKSDYFFTVPMPLDVYGNGPSDPKDTFETLYQIWDLNFQVIATYQTEEEAKFQCDKLNQSM